MTQKMTVSQLRYRRREAISMYRAAQWWITLNTHNLRVANSRWRIGPRQRAFNYAMTLAVESAAMETL